MSNSFTKFAAYFLAKCLSGGLAGIYSGLFAIHLACHASRRETDSSKPHILFYALCTLYVLTVALFAIDTTNTTLPSSDDSITLDFDLYVAGSTLFGCCDFIAQCILIHRCWIVWGRNMRIVIIPSILAFAYLAMWMASTGSTFIYEDDLVQTFWGNHLTVTSLTVSMTVNALVTGLIVFRIFKVFREVKSVTTLEDKSLGITHGNKLRSVTFIIIESGMVLWAIQFARVVVAISQPYQATAASYYALQFIIPIHQMVNGIAPTIILVRVSLGLSYHDKESLVEAVGSLQFAANPISEAGSIDRDRSSHIEHDDDLNPLPVMGNINQERRDDEMGGSDDIQILHR